MAPAAPAPAAFATNLTRAMRRAGLVGAPARTRWANGGLTIAGAESGVLRIEVLGIDRIRFGYEESKHGRYHATRIWRRDNDKPLVVEPYRSDAAAYGRTMQALAEAVAARRGTAAIECGTTTTGAVTVLVLLLLPALAYTAVAVALMRADDWWGWAIGMTLFWALGGVAVHLYRRQRPHAVTAMVELTRYLP